MQSADAPTATYNRAIKRNGMECLNGNVKIMGIRTGYPAVVNYGRKKEIFHEIKVSVVMELV